MSQDCPYVSRGGLKLRHALDALSIDVAGLVCADFGCSTGGFTDCLLQAGAAKVHAVDTAYGQLAWKLRQDPRVHVMERTNILHAEPPADGPVDLVVADAGWTPQRLLVPAALRWLGPSGRILSLVKPHYELKEFGESLPHGGVLEEAAAERIAMRTVERMPEWGVRAAGLTRSPILGGATSGGAKKKGAGNPEWLVLLERAG